MAKPFFVARGQGFEPQLIGPEPIVLPLDDPRIFVCNNLIKLINLTPTLSWPGEGESPKGLTDNFAAKSL